MNRNFELEIEMREIADEVYARLKTDVPMPKIESKQGGHTGTYYRDSHTIRFRSNVWNKLTLAVKRLLVIHEMKHAVGGDHSAKDLYLGSFDLFSLEVYKSIYGFDEQLSIVIGKIQRDVAGFIRRAF